MRASFAIFLLIAFAINAGTAVADTHATPALDNAADLDNYLAHAAPGESPFDRLSPQARIRFVANFGDGGLPIDDLEAELTRDEALAILKLLGHDDKISALTLRRVHLAVGASETPSVTLSFAALRAAGRGTDSHESLLAEYRSRFAPRQSEASLREMSDGDVALFQRAALMVAAVEPGDAHDMFLDLAEAERRAIAAPAWINRVHDLLVVSRDFAAAETFRKRHPDAGFVALPPVRDERHGRGPGVVEIGEHGDELVLRNVSIDRPAQVVVVAGCHFSKDAANAIEADAKMRALFSRDVMWITPAEYNPADPDVVQWNREHPLARMTTAWRESEWPLDMGMMPTFYFLRAGHVKAKVVGWQPDKVREGFQEVGLAR